ncbi:MAG: hypothetical protein [Vetruanivirus porcinprimi]|uniref:Tail fiber protein n=1 Tax=phage Lak_Megaphage_RVC_AP1_GC26 TaxID=3109224 RepID=A0ABZ0Z4X1_9CAUD|nr:MAG: hypothetical protein [phage Lak_Megaphage_RVC_AP1_GC26]
MNKDIRPPQHVLHVFEPNRICRPHDEVEFIKGRYVDIVNTKNKDPDTLYFGTSKNSELLTGIFLGDLELTSKVKDVSLASVNGIVTLSIKYVNSAGKLATVKTNLPSQKLVEDIKKFFEDFDTSILDKINTSVNDVYDRLNVIDSSIVDINDHLTVIDTSLSFLINELDNDNYTIHEDPCTVENGFKKTFTLFKGNKEQENSSKIDATDMVLKQLNYIKGSNIIEAKIWPEHIQTIDLNENTFTLNDGTIIKDSTSTYENLIKTVSLDLSDYDKHVNDFINTDSSINDRLEEVKTQLKWEKIGN